MICCTCLTGHLRLLRLSNVSTRFDWCFPPNMRYLFTSQVRKYACCITCGFPITQKQLSPYWCDFKRNICYMRCNVLTGLVIHLPNCWDIYLFFFNCGCLHKENMFSGSPYTSITKSYPPPPPPPPPPPVNTHSFCLFFFKSNNL